MRAAWSREQQHKAERGTRAEDGGKEAVKLESSRRVMDGYVGIALDYVGSLPEGKKAKKKAKKHAACLSLKLSQTDQELRRIDSRCLAA